MDDKHILFYEQAVATVTENGFTEGPGGPSYNDRQVFSYHIYCAPTVPVTLPLTLGRRRSHEHLVV